MKTAVPTRIINAYAKVWLRRRFSRTVNRLYAEEETGLTSARVPVSYGQPPVILLGMHRSGTTLLSRLLRHEGLRLGRLRGKDTDESLHFQYLNQSMLRAVEGSWDDPLPFIRALDDPLPRAKLMGVLSHFLHSPKKARQFMGFGWTCHRSLLEANQLWGWKDPRTCLTFPLFHAFFPDAKVIFIHRNGVDVAQSLHVRNERLQHTAAHSETCGTLAGAFSLWEIYNQQCLQHLKGVPDGQKMVVGYEQLLEDPKTVLPQLFAFAGFSETIDALHRKIAAIDGGKAHAFREKPQLVDFYQQVKNASLMKQFEYDKMK